MNNVLKFLKENEQISIREMSEHLNIPKGSINVSKSIIPNKHLQPIKDFLIEFYSYDESAMSVIDNEDNDSEPVVIKQYNVGRIPSFDDTIMRYQDSQGLWRRAEASCMAKGSLKEEWEPQTSEILKDPIGEFYVANNGNKMYLSYS